MCAVFPARASAGGRGGWLLRQMSTNPAHSMSFSLRARHQPCSRSQLASGHPSGDGLPVPQAEAIPAPPGAVSVGQRKGSSWSCIPVSSSSEVVFQPMNPVIQPGPQPSRQDGVSTAAAAAVGLPASAPPLEVWPESCWLGFPLSQADVFPSYTE